VHQSIPPCLSDVPGAGWMWRLLGLSSWA
jgi:hypothetical protein